MDLLGYLRKQFQEEMNITRNFMPLVPMDKADWKPHAKSMELGKLAVHIADLPSWVEFIIRTDELDFEAKTHLVPEVKTTDELVELFERNAKLGLNALTEESTKLFHKEWTLRSGETIYSASPKIDVIRMSLSQLIHHRAQLGVYLRLNEIALPGSYGPSADTSF